MLFSNIMLLFNKILINHCSDKDSYIYIYCNEVQCTKLLYVGNTIN